MIFSAWIVGLGLTAWMQGVQQGQWPPPYAFLDLSVVMAGAAIVGAANPRLGGLIGWGLLLPLILRELTDAAHGQGPLTTLPIARAGGGVKAVPTVDVLAGRAG